MVKRCHMMCHVKNYQGGITEERTEDLDDTYRLRRHNKTQKSDNNKQQKKQTNKQTNKTKQKSKENKQKKAADLHVSLLLAGCFSRIQNNTEPGA